MHAQQLLLADHAGGDHDDYGQRVALDRDDNSFVVGEYSGTLHIGGTSLAGAGKWNVYLAKYDPSGHALWARTIAYSTAATSDLYANAVGVDRSGNIYVAGRFVTDVTIGGTAHASLGGSDMYLVKLGPTGEVLWARTPGGEGLGNFGQDGIAALALDDAGNCYVTGTYNKDARFDSIALASPNVFEVFVAKYDSSGRVLWARSGGSNGALHVAFGIAIDKDGDSYITGKFFNTLSFDSFVCDAGDPEQKIFIAKLDRDGRFLWAKEVGSGGYYGAGEDIAVDNEGSAYVVGQFRATINFGDDSHSYGQMRYAFLAVKYDRDGNYKWSRQSAGDDQSVETMRACIDARGNLVASGAFSGGIEFGATSFASAGNCAFVTKIDRDGAYLMARRIEGTSGITAAGIAAMSNGDCELVGSFSDSMTIDTMRVRSSGGYDIYLARLTERDLGVESSRGADAPIIYPNPATDIIRLRNVDPGARVEISAIDGRSIAAMEYRGQIDVRDLAAGIYIVKVGGAAYRLIKRW
jgi:hypothetical protein